MTIAYTGPSAVSYIYRFVISARGDKSLESYIIHSPTVVRNISSIRLWPTRLRSPARNLAPLRVAAQACDCELKK